MTEQLPTKEKLRPVTWWDVVRTHWAALTHDFRGFCRWLDRNDLTIGHGYTVERKRSH